MRNIYTGAAMTGKKILRNTFGIAALVCAASIPGYCATSFLSYTDSWAGLAGAPGTNITTNCSSNPCSNTNETLSSFSVPVNLLTVSNAADAADDGAWTITGGTEVYKLSRQHGYLTMSGSHRYMSGCVGTTNLGGVNGALTTITYTGLTNGIPYQRRAHGNKFRHDRRQ